MVFYWSLLILTARKRNSKETALALEKLLPKRCQVLGLVTPGIVGRSKMCGFLRGQLEGVISQLVWHRHCSVTAK